MATMSAEFICSDPTIYGSTLYTVTVEPFLMNMGVPYNVTYNKAYPILKSQGATEVENVGKWESWPVLRIYGPHQGSMTNPVIWNYAVGKKMDFSNGSGLTLTSGQVLVIDTYPSRRSITIDGETRYNTLTSASDWIDLASGMNYFRFDVNGTDEGVYMTVEYRDAWI